MSATGAQFSSYKWFYSLWKVLKSKKVAITHFAIGIGSKVTHHVVAMEKVAEQHILPKCSKCNTFQVISDLVYDFMNLNALKIMSKIHEKKYLRKIQPWYF